MKIYLIALLAILFWQPHHPLKAQEKVMHYNKLTPEEEKVIIYKGTEAPFTGKYDNFKEAGTYACKRCNAPLYRSKDKFDSH